MTKTYYNWVMKKQLGFRMMPNKNLISNFVGREKGLHVIIGNFTYEIDFMIVEDTRPVIDDCLSQVIFGKPFVEATRMSYVEGRLHGKVVKPSFFVYKICLCEYD